MHTASGQAESFRYSEDKRVNTMRLAMISQLKCPPKGFEDVIKTHFRLRKKFVLEQCQEWVTTSKAKHSVHAASMESAFNELKLLLQKL